MHRSIIMTTKRPRKFGYHNSIIMTKEEMGKRGINPTARQLQAATPVWNGNYARFYGLLRQLPGDHEDIKHQLVLQYTCRRTDSLKEVSRNEYYRMCDRLQELVAQNSHQDAMRVELRRLRSVCLHLMQKLGIDTSDWNRVNAFCQDGRIAGRQFRDLTTDELELLARKLRSIERRGGIKNPETETTEKAKIVSFT